jgi:hypothetical protein
VKFKSWKVSSITFRAQMKIFTHEKCQKIEVLSIAFNLTAVLDKVTAKLPMYQKISLYA